MRRPDPPSSRPTASIRRRWGRATRSVLAATTVVTVACSSGGGRNPDQEAYCGHVDALRASADFDEVILDDAERTTALVDRMLTELDDALGVAPDDVVEQLETVRFGITALRDAVDDADGDVVAAETALREKFLEDPSVLARITAAGESLQRSTDRLCGPPPTTTSLPDDQG